MRLKYPCKKLHHIQAEIQWAHAHVTQQRYQKANNLKWDFNSDILSQTWKKTTSCWQTMTQFKSTRPNRWEPVQTSLRWLPVFFWINVKVLLLFFKCLACLGASYLSELLLPYEPLRALRSSRTGLLIIPKVRTRTHAEALFQFYGPICGVACWRASRQQRISGFLRTWRFTFLC